MRKLTIRTRIIVSFAGVLALIICMAAVAYLRLADIERQATVIGDNAVPGLTYTNQIVIDQIGNYSLTQEFVLQTDVTEKQKRLTEIQARRARLDTLLIDAAGIITSADE